MKFRNADPLAFALNELAESPAPMFPFVYWAEAVVGSERAPKANARP